jgi:RHS repeat-associated protein
VGPLGFTGEWTDQSTGLVYLRARWYDPATGRFLTRDPLLRLSGDPYGYSWNSPLAYRDPGGAWPLPAITGAIGGIVGGIAGGAGYGIDVLTSDRDWSWREFGANTAGGAAGGAAAGACFGASFNPVLCGAAGGATSNLVRTAISGEETFSATGFAVETIGGGVLGGASLSNRIPALRINPGWFTPSRASNIWNPGPWTQRFYGGQALEGLAAVPFGLALGSLSAYLSRC